MTRNLRVSLDRTSVGNLSRTAEGRTAFRFAEPYLATPDRPTLSQSFEDDPRRVYYGRGRDLPAYFANLVPEPGPLRNLLERSLAVPPGDDLALLEAVGSDLPGAVQVARADESLGSDAVQFAPDEEDPEPSEADQHAGLRFSLAGVQMKFSVIRDPERITLPAHDQQGEWIVKLGSSQFPHVVENEYAIMEWARAAGFDVPECHIQNVGSVAPALRRHAQVGGNVFVIRRYDRFAGGRIHQEDLAQVVGIRPELKYDQIRYEQCAALFAALVDEQAYYEFVRRLTFTIASGNADAHLKNWSVVYPDGIQPALAPLYDQVSTIAWPAVKSELALKMAGTKNWFQIDQAQFSHFAEKANANTKQTVSAVHETLERLVIAWNTSHARDVLPKSHIKALQEFWDRVPLLRPFSGSMRWPDTLVSI